MSTAASSANEEITTLAASLRFPFQEYYPFGYASQHRAATCVFGICIGTAAAFSRPLWVAARAFLHRLASSRLRRLLTTSLLCFFFSVHMFGHIIPSSLASAASEPFLIMYMRVSSFVRAPRALRRNAEAVDEPTGVVDRRRDAHTKPYDLTQINVDNESTKRFNEHGHGYTSLASGLRMG